MVITIVIIVFIVIVVDGGGGAEYNMFSKRSDLLLLWENRI